MTYKGFFNIMTKVFLQWKWMKSTISLLGKGGVFEYEDDISAEEETEIKGSWF